MESIENLNHKTVKIIIEIRARNQFTQGFLQGHCTVCWIPAMGLADILGIADLHRQKVESTKWLKHKLRATLGGQ